MIAAGMMPQHKEPTVWITNLGNHQYESASRFGTLRAVTSGNVNVFSADNLTAEVHAVLDAGGASGDDLVLISGYGIPVGLVMHYFLTKFGSVKLLVWGAIRGQYQVVTYNNRPC